MDVHLWCWLIGAVMNAYAMGMAGSQGMLRRTLYEGGQFQPYVAVAMVGGILMGVGLLVFLVNLISTVGLVNVLRLFLPEGRKSEPSPAKAQA